MLRDYELNAYAADRRDRLILRLITSGCLVGAAILAAMLFQGA